MGTKTQNTRYHEPYTNLAYAIVASGIKCHDVRFLESDWCELLREMCRLDDQMYGDRNIGVRGKAKASCPHIEVEAD
jgi:hypothetical protein